MERFLSFAAAMLFAAASVAHAQAPDHWRALVGNWTLEFQKEGVGIATGEFAFHPGPNDGSRGRAGGIVTEQAAAPRYLPYTCTGGVQGASVKLTCGTYGFTHRLSYLSMQLSPDGTTLRGTWAGTPDGSEGSLRWTRARPAIRSVEVLTNPPGGLDFLKLKRTWDYRGAPPSFRVRLRGEAMPLWVNVYAQPHIVVAIDDPLYRIGPESLSVNDLAGRWQQGVLEYPVLVLPGATGGRKRITVNGASREFDVVFFGTLEGAARDARP